MDESPLELEPPAAADPLATHTPSHRDAVQTPGFAARPAHVDEGAPPGSPEQQTASGRTPHPSARTATKKQPTTVLGHPFPHESSREHVTGEATYIDDFPPTRDELLVDFVGSRLAHASIKAIDVSTAARIPGIVAVYTAADVPGENVFGPIFHDEELLAAQTCHYIGQPLVVLAGETREALRAGKEAVRTDLEELPRVLTIDEAIAANQFFGPTRWIKRGDVTAALATSEHVIEGTFHSGGQDQFYLESQAAIAVPGDGGRMTILSSTQHPTEIQAVVARCLGLRQNQVVCECPRMGGGFGGKESQAAHPALLAALVAYKTKRRARVVYTKELDMRVTGKRHPYQARYKVGFDAEGVIAAMQVAFHSNGGASADLSLAIMERSMLHADNAYYIPNIEISGTVCRTNLPPNTAMRGFGGPQGVAAVENIIEEIAATLRIDALQVRRRNCYGINDRNITPYGQVVRNNTLPALLERLAEDASYPQRLADVIAFNSTSRTRLKGLSLTAVKFGISFTRRTLNQGNALVNIYLDGTIQVSTGGTEMGQGLNTKIRQLVAHEFSLPPESVQVMHTSTEKNNNTSPTAASASTDLNGTAAVRACKILRRRLAEVAARHFASAEEGREASAQYICFRGGVVTDRRTPGARLTFAELVQRAYEQRVDLGARGFYATPGVDFNRETGKGNPFFYFTNGCALAEVEIDRLTGELKVSRVDILIDIGRSINPAIDRGQVIGGFVQGLGWATTEELRYSDTGDLLTHSPNTYKIPNINDVPADFHVDFFDRESNRMNLHGNKAVGEPPLLLGICVWTAVKHALSCISRGQVPRLNLPATTEEILVRLAEHGAFQKG
jgi:xanthine dehydrogenase large subunit